MSGTPLTGLDLVRGVSEWFARREAADGSLLCPRHRVEHGGKTIYTAVLDLVLARRAEDAAVRGRHEERVRRRVLRALRNVRADDKSGRAVFLPGSTDHRNASTNLIDSGACCDVIGEVLEERPDLFSEEERSHALAVLERVASGALAEGVLVKEVPAQRLWGATGLARAARLLERADLAQRALEAVARALDQAHEDGSFPYMPDPERHGEHKGLADVTSYYHSRHVGFIVHVHELLGRDPEPRVRAFVARALAFLAALYGRDGIKPLCVEAKQWYWESDYEVASHSFDVHALLAAADWTDAGARYRRLARLSFERLAEHVLEDGGVTSHHGPGTNFQCRDFWNAHVAWIARVVDRLPDRLEAEPPPLGLRTFPDAGILRIDRDDWSATLRGRKQPINISFGGTAGGGSLIYFGRRESGFRDEVRLPKWSSCAPGNFTIVPAKRPGFRQRVVEFYRENRHDVRFRLYVANIERRAGNTRLAIEYPLRHVVEKLRDELKGRYASHFDVEPSVTLASDDEVLFAAMPARRSGEVLAGAALTRRYRALRDGLEVEEELFLEEPVRAVLYRRIPVAEDLEVESDAPGKRNAETFVFAPTSAPVRVRVRYRLGGVAVTPGAAASP